MLAFSYQQNKQHQNMGFTHHVALLLFSIYKPVYHFTGLFYTDLLSWSLKARQPHKGILRSTLCGPANRNRLISVEGNVLLCNDDREGWPGQM